jgi:hypothetical protein
MYGFWCVFCPQITTFLLPEQKGGLRLVFYLSTCFVRFRLRSHFGEVIQR